MTAQAEVSWRTWFTRWAGFVAFWSILAGPDPADLAIGVLTAVAAAWTSLRLLPPDDWQLRPVALVRFVGRFLRQSVVAGVDVAWRALDPRLRLRPGLLAYHTRLPPGAQRNAFCTITSLLPGTLPCGSDEHGDLLIHCLNVAQPVAQQLATEEALQVQTLGGAR